MKVVNYSSLTYDQIANYIRSLNIPFVGGTGATLTIGPSDGNHIDITWVYQNTSLSVNGGSSVNPWRVNDSQSIIVIYDDNFLCFQLTDGSRRGFFLYEKISDDLFIYGYTGTAWNTSHAFYNIEEVTFYDFNGTSYSHPKILNYPCQPGYIDYVETYIFTGGHKDALDPNLMSCSTVLSNNSVSIDGINYFAIGTNTLAPIDEPE